jgi:hypothetical protein
MATIPEAIDRIRELYATQLPPADDAQLGRAEQVFRSEFGIAMPDGYRALLSTVNGLVFNSVMFYSTEDGQTAKGAARFGLGEANERLLRGVETIDTTLRFVGETGSQLFAYDTADATWKVVDRVGWDVDSSDDVFATFDALFDAQVIRFVDW